MSATVASRSPWARRGISSRSWESVSEEACVIVMAIDNTVILEASRRLYEASTRLRSVPVGLFAEYAAGGPAVACG
jgi:hypothetical protein